MFLLYRRVARRARLGREIRPGPVSARSATRLGGAYRVVRDAGRILTRTVRTSSSGARPHLGGRRDRSGPIAAGSWRLTGDAVCPVRAG